MPSNDPMMGVRKPFGFNSDPDPKVMMGVRGPFSWAKDKKKEVETIPKRDDDQKSKSFGLAPGYSDSD
jgi:hypothetical protein